MRIRQLSLLPLVLFFIFPGLALQSLLGLSMIPQKSMKMQVLSQNQLKNLTLILLNKTKI